MQKDSEKQAPKGFLVYSLVTGHECMAGANDANLDKDDQKYRNSQET